MIKADLSRNKRVLSSAKNQNSILSDLVSGAMCSDTYTILQSWDLDSDFAASKFVQFCQRNSLVIKSRDMDLLIKAMYLQLQLSEQIIPTIHAHLQDTKTNNLASMLNNLAANIQAGLPEDAPLSMLKCLIKDLNLFTASSDEEKFIESIIILMVNYYHKHRFDVAPCYLESARWLKSLLAISEKSHLTGLIDYIAIRLNISHTKIGTMRGSVELTNLLYLFEDLLQKTGVNLCKLSISGLVRKIDVLVILDLVCRKEPDSLIDLVSKKDAIDIVSTNPYLSAINKKLLRPYFPKAPDSLNTQVFVNTCLNMFQSQLRKLPDTNNLKHYYLEQLLKSDSIIDDSDYANYVKFIEIPEHIVKELENSLLTNILEDKLQDVNLNFVANRLLKQGITPRSKYSSTIGVFQPLIISNKPKLDLTNLQVLCNAFKNTDKDTKCIYAKELLFGLIYQHRINPPKLENQPRPQPKRMVDMHHALPRRNPHKAIPVFNGKISGLSSMSIFANKSTSKISTQVAMHQLIP